MSNDAFADLGLDLGSVDDLVQAADAAVKVVDDANPEEPVVVAQEKKTRKAVELGELEYGFADFVPEETRAGGVGRESRWDFDKLEAPQAYTGEDGKTKFKYATITARLVDGETEERLRGAVSGAIAGEHRKKNGKKYTTRQLVKDGEFAGLTIFRVDNTLG